jgi:hypothetical protein
LGCLVAVTAALGDEIPGAAYSGTLPDGATVEFTVSGDGTRLVAYRISDVQGDTCKFTAQGREGSWETPVANHAFHYTLYVNSVDFMGRFDGDQSATGTFRMHNDAVGAKPACDSGTVSWTATTTASPAGSGGPGPGDRGGASGTGTTGATGGSALGEARKRFHTSVTLHTKSRRTLAGRISSASVSCRARRRVVLKRGSRTLASAMSRADGSFRFTRSKASRGRAVRAVARARNGSTATCIAGSSKPVKA